ncbi:MULTISPECIES: hypothetical protein [Eubacteriales]|uniref:Uncharacterized protein n=1 Tax=Ruminiclostridium papyrosolvens C7 TaxID=1330534 RepID=U4R3P2_9FIRM|nr:MULTISPECIES: hypothetical protein [Eubacteriales]AEY66481.1 hypothetical protein Clo1100_2306 [Clostridium sp. BNL1100]EPR13161.1 hypothetical protein L323_04510 [Ruminiclostridium papyrosolvens C7]
MRNRKIDDDSLLTVFERIINSIPIRFQSNTRENSYDDSKMSEDDIEKFR